MHYYKILRHKAGFDEGTSYWEKILARYLAATGGGKILTTLPITFTSTSWKLASWTIYGNNEPGTENLWDLTIEQGSFDPTTGATAVGSRRVRTAESILLSANSWTVASTGADRCGVYVYDTSGNYIASESQYYWQALPYTFTLSGERKVKFVFSTNDDAQITPSMVSQPMLVKGSTAPDHYIPYQKGVGQRTKNLLEIAETSQTIRGVTFTVDKIAGTIIANGTANSIVYLHLPINALSGDYYYSGCALGGSLSTYELYAWDNTINGRPKKWNGKTNVDSDYGGTSQEIKVDREHSMLINIRIYSGYTCNNLVFKPMLRKADTTDEFIPYGYQVPLDIRHKTKNLLKDEWRQGNAQDPTTTVRCCATSVIPTVLGDIFSFGLYNATKRYAIYGINAAGLAEFNQTQTVSVSNRIYNPGFTTDNKTVTTEDENIVAYWVMLAQTEGTIPATIVPDDCKNSIVIVRGTDLPSSYEPYYLTNHEDIYIGAAPLTEGQTVSNTQDIEVFEGENTIDATLYNKPVMEIEYE